MAMDVRDVSFWAAEARRRVLMRRYEAYNSALFPRQEPRAIELEMTRLQTQLREIDEADEITETEQENARRMAEQNAKLRERQKRKRAMGAAGKKRRRKAPAKAKVLR